MQSESSAVQIGPVASQKGAIASFIEDVIGLVVVALLVAGLVSLTLTWRSSDILFDGNGQTVTVTKSSWWGWKSEIIEVEASPQDGWTIVEKDRSRKPLRAQAMRLPD